MRPVAILFDIDDTLYDQVVPFGKAVEKVFPGLAGVSHEALFQRRGYHGEISFHMVLNQQMTMEEMYCYRVQKPLAEFGVVASDEEALAFQEAYEQYQKQLELSDVMEQMLEKCHARGAVLGVITNGPAEHQRNKAHTLGVQRWIPEERILVSGEVGIVKPDLRIFRIAEERMGLDPETMDIWFVGDSFANDIAGAAGAGWKTIWLNRRGKAIPQGDVIPDLVVRTDEELYEAMQKILG